MSDLSVVEEMLTRAGIPHRREVAPSAVGGGRAEFNVPSVRLLVPHGADEHATQPNPGGYVGFFAELVFRAEDGSLAAVWAWE